MSNELFPNTTIRKNIISASRRSDIPAFFGNQFLKAIKRGFVEVPNPYSGKKYRVSLQPRDVSVIIFWSKNYQPFLSVLNKIAPDYDGRFLFHFTINGFSKKAQEILEPNIPSISDLVQTAASLYAKFGKHRILWRFDPIIFSNLSDFDERLKAFGFLAEQLRKYCSRCYVSFVDKYGKIKRHFRQIEESGKMKFETPDFSKQVDFFSQIQTIANKNNIKLYSCCEKEVAVRAGVTQAHCIDINLLKELFPEEKFTEKISPTRKDCGCFQSKDIGVYNSCRHGCVYCYANK